MNISSVFHAVLLSWFSIGFVDSIDASKYDYFVYRSMLHQLARYYDKFAPINTRTIPINSPESPVTIVHFLEEAYDQTVKQSKRKMRLRDIPPPLCEVEGMLRFIPDLAFLCRINTTIGLGPILTLIKEGSIESAFLKYIPPTANLSTWSLNISSSFFDSYPKLFSSYKPKDVYFDLYFYVTQILFINATDRVQSAARAGAEDLQRTTRDSLRFGCQAIDHFFPLQKEAKINLINQNAFLDLQKFCSSLIKSPNTTQESFEAPSIFSIEEIEKDYKSVSPGIYSAPLTLFVLNEDLDSLFKSYLAKFASSSYCNAPRADELAINIHTTFEALDLSFYVFNSILPQDKARERTERYLTDASIVDSLKSGVMLDSLKHDSWNTNAEILGWSNKSTKEAIQKSLSYLRDALFDIIAEFSKYTIAGDTVPKVKNLSDDLRSLIVKTLSTIESQGFQWDLLFEKEEKVCVERSLSCSCLQAIATHASRLALEFLKIGTEPKFQSFTTQFNASLISKHAQEQWSKIHEPILPSQSSYLCDTDNVAESGGSDIDSDTLKDESEQLHRLKVYLNKYHSFPRTQPTMKAPLNLYQRPYALNQMANSEQISPTDNEVFVSSLIPLSFSSKETCNGLDKKLRLRTYLNEPQLIKRGVDVFSHLKTPYRQKNMIISIYTSPEISTYRSESIFWNGVNNLMYTVLEREQTKAEIPKGEIPASITKFYSKVTEIGKKYQSITPCSLLLDPKLDYIITTSMLSQHLEMNIDPEKREPDHRVAKPAFLKQTTAFGSTVNNSQSPASAIVHSLSHNSISLHGGNIGELNTTEQEINVHTVEQTIKTIKNVVNTFKGYHTYRNLIQTGAHIYSPSTIQMLLINEMVTLSSYLTNSSYTLPESVRFASQVFMSTTTYYNLVRHSNAFAVVKLRAIDTYQHYEELLTLPTIQHQEELRDQVAEQHQDDTNSVEDIFQKDVLSGACNSKTISSNYPLDLKRNETLDAFLYVGSTSRLVSNTSEFSESNSAPLEKAELLHEKDLKNMEMEYQDNLVVEKLSLSPCELLRSNSILSKEGLFENKEQQTPQRELSNPELDFVDLVIKDITKNCDLPFFPPDAETFSDCFPVQTDENKNKHSQVVFDDVPCFDKYQNDFEKLFSLTKSIEPLVEEEKKDISSPKDNSNSSNVPGPNDSVLRPDILENISLNQDDFSEVMPLHEEINLLFDRSYSEKKIEYINTPEHFDFTQSTHEFFSDIPAAYPPQNIQHSYMPSSEGLHLRRTPQTYFPVPNNASGSDFAPYANHNEPINRPYLSYNQQYELSKTNLSNYSQNFPSSSPGHHQGYSHSKIPPVSQHTPSGGNKTFSGQRMEMNFLSKPSPLSEGTRGSLGNAFFYQNAPPHGSMPFVNGPFPSQPYAVLQKPPQDRQLYTPPRHVPCGSKVQNGNAGPNMKFNDTSVPDSDLYPTKNSSATSGSVHSSIPTNDTSPSLRYNIPLSNTGFSLLKRESASPYQRADRSLHKQGYDPLHNKKNPISANESNVYPPSLDSHITQLNTDNSLSVRREFRSNTHESLSLNRTSLGFFETNDAPKEKDRLTKTRDSPSKQSQKETSEGSANNKHKSPIRIILTGHNILNM